MILCTTMGMLDFCGFLVMRPDLLEQLKLLITIPHKAPLNCPGPIGVLWEAWVPGNLAADLTAWWSISNMKKRAISARCVMTLMPEIHADQLQKMMPWPRGLAIARVTREDLNLWVLITCTKCCCFNWWLTPQTNSDWWVPSYGLAGN